MTLYKRALFKRFKDNYAPDEVDKLALLIIVSFLTIFSIIGCIESYASEIENVPIQRMANLIINPEGNYFIESTGSVGYISLERGYRYTITNNDSSGRYFAFSNEIAQVDGVYYDKGVLPKSESYTFITTNNNNYLYFNYSWYNDQVTITREKITGQTGAISDLVDNVGTNQIWDIFNISIDYIIIAVAVAFGIFLIVLAIRKVTKGKSEF